VYGQKRVGKSYLCSVLKYKLDFLKLVQVDVNSLILKFNEFDVLKIYLDLVFQSIEGVNHMIILDHMDLAHPNKIFQR